MYRQPPIIDPEDEKRPAQQLEGIMERVTYHAEDSGYSVLKMAVRETPDPVTVVGNFPNPNAGESLLFIVFRCLGHLRI